MDRVPGVRWREHGSVWPSISTACCLALLAATAVVAAPPRTGPAPQPCQAPPSQAEEYAARHPKTVVELQQFRTVQRGVVRDSLRRTGTATLTDLSPRIGAWFVLDVAWDDGTRDVYHLENPDPGLQRLRLDPAFPAGLMLVTGKVSTECPLWSELAAARKVRQPSAPLCGGRLYLRQPTAGHKTSREWATDFLRTHVWGGEQITVFVRERLYQDAFLQTSEVVPGEAWQDHVRPAGAPGPLAIDVRYDEQQLTPEGLGISLEDVEPGGPLVGRWYRARDLAGVYVCALQPRTVAAEVVLAQGDQVKPLDEVEAAALAYLVAFDLSMFELGFAVGTEHPRVDWSDMVQPTARDASLPGPDGIGAIAPLVGSGMLRPEQGERAVATFTGGFKRYHGAFRRSDLATRNEGTHYGFIESGVVLSKLQPGLATVLVYADGRVDMKVWSSSDDVDLCRIRHARQNGVPIVATDPGTGAIRPGAMVRFSALGNWSASVDRRYRTLRAGIGLQESAGRRFLVYGYFSSATPSAMARVFQAAGCRMAMPTDMNALEHTYLAVYRQQQGSLVVQHLIDGMKVLDKVSGQQTVPRFVGYADNRDFFYLLRRNGR